MMIDMSATWADFEAGTRWSGHITPCRCPHCASEGFIDQGPDCRYWPREDPELEVF